MSEESETALESFTLLFYVDHGVSQVQIDAHCEKCAFIGAMAVLSKEHGDRKICSCIGVYKGNLDNLWPKVAAFAEEEAKKRGAFFGKGLPAKSEEIN